MVKSILASCYCSQPLLSFPRRRENINRVSLKPGRSSVPLQKVLPEFTARDDAPLIIRSTLPFAKKYCFNKPYTVLISGQGYLVIDGDALYYYPFSWSGENRHWVLEDVHYLLSIAQKRICSPLKQSLGKWPGFSIEGTNKDLIMLTTSCAHKRQLIFTQKISAHNYVVSF